MMLASMQRLAKKPSAFAIYGAVCTTLGGATATPTLILRCGPAQVCAEAGVAMSAPRMKAAAIAACVWSVGMERSSLLLLILRRRAVGMALSRCSHACPGELKTALGH